MRNKLANSEWKGELLVERGTLSGKGNSEWKGEYMEELSEETTVENWPT